ncbi:MAG: DNA translocase FtsK, partial [Verrucomicrobia bacterium]|nr:DNA translocase FtsK [Verrucomicrobiota bacterium]
PSVDLLQKSEKDTRPTYTEDELKTNQQRIMEALAHFDIEVSPGDITRGSTITRYELYPAPGVRVERIVNLERDLARTMKAERINILAPVPGRDTVAIEVANASKVKVLLRDLIESEEWNSSRATLIDDLADLPHALIAGTTGSGKSVCINTLLLSLLYRFSPDDLRLILIDPKVVELQVYNRLPHLVVPVVTEPKKVLLALRWVINEMEKRYRYMAKASVRNIVTFNTRIRTPKRVEELDLAPRLAGEEPPPPSTEEPLPDRLPYIVVIIDELANLMQVAPADVENAIALLSAKARAAGIHLVIATQTPRAAVITGVIKTNVPARIAFQVPSGVDSRVILDESGAENLLGKGDLLYLRPGASKLIRAQGAFVTEEEVSRVIDFIAAQAKPFYEQEIHAKHVKPSSGDSELSEKDEELMSRSLEVIKQEKRASTSLLQRRLGLGYGRAAWVIDQFESRGMIGPKDGAKDREILVDLDTVQL